MYLPQPPASSNCTSTGVQNCFRKELTELSNGSDYYVNACGYCRLSAASYAAIDMGEPEVTSAPAMDAVISDPTFVLTGQLLGDLLL